MSVDQRHRLILRRVRDRGSARLADLAEEMGVSAVTLRRDVEQLAARGLLSRVHGGVTLPREIGAPAPAGPPPTIGMLVPTARYYYPGVIKGARERAAALGARLVLGISHYEDSEDRAQVRQLVEEGADGLLLSLSGQPGETHATWLAGLRVPAVLVERRAEFAGQAPLLDGVASDHAHGAYLAVRHLAELGHRALAVVANPSPTTPRIRAGVLAGAAAMDLDPPAKIVVDRSQAPEDLVRGVLRLIRDGGVTGLLVHNDEDALSLVRHLSAAGVDIPGKVSLVAYDDEVAEFCTPSLTAVAPPKEEVGRSAVDLLVARLERPGATIRHVALLPELRVRESTAPLSV